MSNVAIIGAGLFGSIVADALALDGHRVEVWDARLMGAASPAAACLMKRSWLGSALVGSDIDKGLALLDQLYGVHELRFALPPTRGHVSVDWVSPATVLRPDQEIRLGLVKRITRVRGSRRWLISAEYHGQMSAPAEADVVIVAAGVWCNDIQVLAEWGQEPEAIHVEGLVARAGSAFLWPEESVLEGLIAPWAPYKQIVAFNRGDGLWAGDGSAVKPENWTQAQSYKALERCRRAVWPLPSTQATTPVRELHGLRPYVQGARPCYLAEHHPGLWVLTGGAKNGTAAAAWAARQLRERLT